MQGKGLLDADLTYRADEQSNLWKAAVKAVKDRVDQNRPLTEAPETDALMSIVGMDEDAIRLCRGVRPGGGFRSGFL